MQSYREEAGSRPPTSQLDPLPAPEGGRMDDVSKYQARYEETMNPFEAFRGRVTFSKLSSCVDPHLTQNSLVGGHKSI